MRSAEDRGCRGNRIRFVISTSTDDTLEKLRTGRYDVFQRVVAILSQRFTIARMQLGSG
jgi:hypothetical protein